MPSHRNEAREQWIRERLDEHGLALQAIDTPHVRPWGTVLRLDTDGGTFWFKAPIAPLTYELPLVELLAVGDRDRVPRIVAADRARGWMLTEDAGLHVTDLHPDGVPLKVWKEFLPLYAQLQLDVARDAETLVAAGVPDRRSNTLVEGFLRVLDSDRHVRPPTDDALDDEELRRLRSLVPRIERAIEVVAALGLPDSIQHDDLHAWNVCVGDGRYRFIDWGDACVAQPLLSLGVPLAHVGDDGAEEARDAYLEPWTAIAPRGELVAATDGAVVLAQITGALKWELINSSLTDEERAGYEHTIPRRLRVLLELTCA
jgi:phosphotransferase family enzyme